MRRQLLLIVMDSALRGETQGAIEELHSERSPYRPGMVSQPRKRTSFGKERPEAAGRSSLSSH